MSWSDSHGSDELLRSLHAEPRDGRAHSSLGGACLAFNVRLLHGEVRRARLRRDHVEPDRLQHRHEGRRGRPERGHPRVSDPDPALLRPDAPCDRRDLVLRRPFDAALSSRAPSSAASVPVLLGFVAFHLWSIDRKFSVLEYIQRKDSTFIEENYARLLPAKAEHVEGKTQYNSDFPGIC